MANRNEFTIAGVIRRHGTPNLLDVQRHGAHLNVLDDPHFSGALRRHGSLPSRPGDVPARQVRKANVLQLFIAVL